MAVLRRPELLIAREARRLLSVGVEQHLVARSVGPDEVHHALEHRELEVLATSPTLACKQRRGDRLRRGERGDLVRGGVADQLRLAGGTRLHRGEAAIGLHDRVVGALVRVRPRGAEAADRDVDELRVRCRQLAVAEAEPLDHAGAEVLHEYVGSSRKPSNHVASRLGSQVHRDRALSAVGNLRHRRHPADRGPHPAPDVADVGRLHLHDVGALVCQDSHRPRARERDAQVDDPDSVERSLHAASLPSFVSVRHSTPAPEVDPCANGSPTSSPAARPGSTR